MLREVLLPRTDAGVYAQAAVVFPALTAAVVFVRRDPEVRLLALGVLVMTLGCSGCAPCTDTAQRAEGAP